MKKKSYVIDNYTHNIYAAPQIWYAGLYNWIDKFNDIDLNRDKIINNIVATCNRRLGKLEDIVKGKFDYSEYKEVEFYGPYINFPKLKFKHNKIDFTAEIRINPCFISNSDDTHHSKIWVIITSYNVNFVDIKMVKELLNNEIEYAKKIEDLVKDFYLKETEIPDAKKKAEYTITIQNYGVSGATEKSTDKLFSTDEGDRASILKDKKTTKMIFDLMNINFNDDIEEPEKKVKDLSWKIAKLGVEKPHSMLYGARFDNQETVITGIASTSDPEIIHALFRPVAIRIANSM